MTGRERLYQRSRNLTDIKWTTYTRMCSEKQVLALRCYTPETGSFVGTTGNGQV